MRSALRSKAAPAGPTDSAATGIRKLSRKRSRAKLVRFSSCADEVRTVATWIGSVSPAEYEGGYVQTKQAEVSMVDLLYAEIRRLQQEQLGSRACLAT